MFDTHTNKAICVLPWVHEHLDLSGQQKPCCYGSPLSVNNSLDNVRRLMLEGQQPSVCNRCYEQEKQGESSPRIRETVKWVKKFAEPKIDEIDIQYIDVRNDPTCNLKCKTCGPGASTLWAKEKGITLIKPKYDLNKYNKKNLKKVYMAGGEPTYNESYLEFLNDLAIENLDCEIVINTNLKNLPSRWKKIIPLFKNFTVTVSCDAIKQLGSYVRYPLEWNKFEENINFCRNNNISIMFNLVASNITVHDIKNTVEWMSQYTNSISLSPVIGDIWTHAAVPIDQRQRYIDNLTKLKKFHVDNYHAHQFRLNVESLIKKYSEDNYNKNLHEMLKNEIKLQDMHRTLQLKDVDIFLNSWIFN